MNPLLADWDTPFGVPPFHEIEDGHYRGAFRAAMAEQKKEVAAIVACAEAATFANTIEALERSGRTLRRVSKVFFGSNSACSNETIRDLAAEIAPEISAHRDDVVLDRALFERVEAVWDRRESLGLRPEQEKLLEETRKTFVRAGVHLVGEAQARLREINRELAALQQRFGRNVLAATNAFELHVTRREDLGGLPPSLVAAAAEEARSRGHASGWSFTLAQPSCEPFLRHSPNRELRRRIFEAYAARCDGGEFDNNAGLVTTAGLRAERARLLGYASHAHYVLEDAMAETPGRVFELLDRMWQPALAAASSERDALAALMREDSGEELEGWDWRYYAERLRQARCGTGDEALRPYFELGAVRDGAFEVAQRLFGLRFRELARVPTRHPDQQAFEVTESDGRHLGVLYMDFYARESKRAGAWMNSLRSQSKLDGEVAAVVTTDFNFPPPAAGSPSLLSFDDARTLFHEFGHALHGLLSDVTYESLSGTQVPRDFVEFPSQLMENWMSEPEVLALYARHFETGEAIPAELIARTLAAEKLGQGFATAEYTAACYLDLAWHTLSEPEILDPAAFEGREMRRIGLIDEILPRYRSPCFSHIFHGGYPAGYYGYLWAEVLDADAFEAFRQAGLFDPGEARELRRLLSQGGSRPGMELYREFRGREPEIGPLLARRGLRLDP